MYEYTIRMADGTEHTSSDATDLMRWVVQHGDVSGYLALNLVQDETVANATWQALTRALQVETGIALSRQPAVENVA